MLLQSYIPCFIFLIVCTISNTSGTGNNRDVIYKKLGEIPFIVYNKHVNLKAQLDQE